MSRDRLIIIGVVLLAVLGFLVYKQADKDKKLGTTSLTAASSADLPTISAPADVDKITIKDGKKDEIVLEKKGELWVLTKPVSAPASQQAVKEVVTNLGTLKVKEQVNMTVDDELKKSKKLDADQAIHIVTYKGADKKTDLSFSGGSPGALGHLMMVESKPGVVYATSGFSSYLYAKEPKDWREKEVLKFDDANANQVTITNKTGDYSFTKGDKGWGATLKGQPLPRFDEQRIKDVLHELKALNAEDFGDGKTPADTGLDAPEGTIKVSLKDGAGTYTLKVGKPAPNATSRYAMKDGDATAFVIGKPAADWALADKDKFQRPLDAGAPDAGKDASGGPSKMEMPPGMGMPGGMPGMPPGHPGMPPGH